ncbi:hypothetical protein KORDIASMS9_01789 [Kordia sp. SMS9]|uniref:hypothetical protein n=1 Tax=Kordia sp. SMS9 TaxID=2282170 RepID=UPI000E0CEC43|nr:hypothetical protein [Kordia sp. SMS9]AXG69566.1 hypothetical protein KORDIASMS9_01789 [Kordia sp. SMS9]
MKRKSLKSLALNKNKVSSLIDMQLKGGDTSSTFGELSYRGWTCPHEVSEYCGSGTTEPAPTQDNASACKCK